VTDKDFDIAETILRLRRCAGFWALNGMGAAILAGIEGALWDLKGQIEGEPVWKLLKGGGAYEKQLCYATGAISNWPIEKLLEKFDTYIALGFKAVKVASGFLDDSKFPAVEMTAVGGDAIVEQEREKCRMIREHLDSTGNSDVKICFDAHQGNLVPGNSAAWDVDTAARVIEAIAPYGVLFYEEVLRYENVEGYAEVCKRVAHTGVPVAGGECLTSMNEWKSFSEKSALDVAQPDAAFCCGLSEYVEIAAMFHKQGKHTACHSWGVP